MKRYAKKTAALRDAVFPLFAKNLKGGGASRRRSELINNATFLGYDKLSALLLNKSVSHEDVHPRKDEILYSTGCLKK